MKKLLPNFLESKEKYISAPIVANSPEHEIRESLKKIDFVHYEKHRNDPGIDALSGVSKYLHFGVIWSKTVVDIVGIKDTESFLEELIIRKELSDNYCMYATKYRSLDHIANWAKAEHAAHSDDIREYVYSLEELEKSKTHSELWNLAQTEMVKTGKMHGYMRMFWAKKIFEWTKSPAQALEFSLELNDKYEIDGYDPNGIVGCLWSIGGLHDRAWASRNVFGKIRYMSEASTKNKISYDKYKTQVTSQ